jgi:hypothetical protein
MLTKFASYENGMVIIVYDMLYGRELIRGAYE